MRSMEEEASWNLNCRMFYEEIGHWGRRNHEGDMERRRRMECSEGDGKESNARSRGGFPPSHN